MRGIRKYKASIAGMLAFVGVVVVLLAVNWGQYNEAVQENERSSKVQTEILQLGQDLKKTTDELTYMARSYVVTKDISYFKGYWDLVLNGKGRIPILDQIEKYDLDEEEKVWLREMRSNCIELENREVFAMKMLVVQYNKKEIKDEDIREYIDYVLEYSLFDAGWKIELLPQMLYLIDEEYESFNAQLLKNMDAFVQRMQGNLIELTIQMNENSRKAV